jgi:hypothetical protein
VRDRNSAVNEGVIRSAAYRAILEPKTIGLNQTGDLWWTGRVYIIKESTGDKSGSKAFDISAIKPFFRDSFHITSPFDNQVIWQNIALQIRSWNLDFQIQDLLP